MLAENALEKRQAAGGETQREAFLRLLDGYEPALRRLASCYFDRNADREDLFQEIAVGLWQAIPRFRGDSSERTWLYRIAHNVAISSAAKMRRRGRIEAPVPELFDLASEVASAEQANLHNEKLRLLYQSIRECSMHDRQIVLLHLEGLSYSEIEEVTGRSQNAIATRLSRIRERLKASITGRPRK